MERLRLARMKHGEIFKERLLGVQLALGSHVAKKHVLDLACDHGVKPINLMGTVDRADHGLCRKKHVENCANNDHSCTLLH